MAEHRLTESTLYVVDNTYEIRNGRVENVSDKLQEKAPSDEDIITCSCGDGPFETLEDAKDHLRNYT